jgi:hypothetical protein
MTPADALASLDAQLAENGENITFRRDNASSDEKTVRAKVRFYKPDEIKGLIQQGDRHIILSPTYLGAYGVPLQNSIVLIGGLPNRIVWPEPIKVNSTIVRIELQTRGF